jgi:hypothetical protein
VTEVIDAQLHVDAGSEVPIIEDCDGIASTSNEKVVDEV